MNEKIIYPSNFFPFPSKSGPGADETILNGVIGLAGNAAVKITLSQEIVEVSETRKNFVGVTQP